MVGTVNITIVHLQTTCLSIADISVNEGAGSVALTVSVNLSGQNIDVDYATVNGTALAVGDFADNDTLTFLRGKFWNNQYIS